MLGKSWFISELTSTNSSHSVCGFSQLWRTCLQRLRFSSQSRGRNKEAVCMWRLPCREPQSTHNPATVCSSHLLAPANFLCHSPAPGLGLTKAQTLYKDGTQLCVCVCVCVHVHACVHACLCPRVCKGQSAETMSLKQSSEF